MLFKKVAIQCVANVNCSENTALKLHSFFNLKASCYLDKYQMLLMQSLPYTNVPS